MDLTGASSRDSHDGLFFTMFLVGDDVHHPPSKYSHGVYGLSFHELFPSRNEARAYAKRLEPLVHDSRRPCCARTNCLLAFDGKEVDRSGDDRQWVLTECQLMAQNQADRLHSKYMG